MVARVATVRVQIEKVQFNSSIPPATQYCTVAVAKMRFCEEYVFDVEADCFELIHPIC